MLIKSIKKLTKGRYKIIIDDNELILYEQILIKYSILKAKEIDPKLIKEIEKENQNIEMYETSLRYLDTKMRTEKEVIKYLTDKYNYKDVENLLIRLKKEGLIDDSKYVKSFINDKINLSNDGPYKIKRDLIQKRIIEDLIEIDIDNNILLDKLRRIMPRYINLYKKNSKNMIKNKTVNYFLNLGYDKEIIEEVFDSLDVKGDNTKIKKDYEKLIKKYKAKYSGYKLESTIKQKLFQKGYSIDEINEIEKGTI